MKRVLLTGATGFVGRNIMPMLEDASTVLAPRRAELDLMDPTAVAHFLDENAIDVVVHSANPNPVKSARFDSADRMFEDSLRMFMSFYQARSYCEKVIYLGSGAEFDKRFPIVRITEEEVHRSLPMDAYGLSKSIMNDLAQSTSAVHNLRLFACYGPYDHESKFITHCIRSILRGATITIRQNCLFDYLHVRDLGRVVAYAVNHDLSHCDYNVASGAPVSLVAIAQLVREQMNSSCDIVVSSEGMNNEYTACVDRLESETGLVCSFMSLEEGVAEQIAFETKLFKRGDIS